jgi:hypothetical protein
MGPLPLISMLSESVLRLTEISLILLVANGADEALAWVFLAVAPVM